ncbi:MULTISPECIES: hypothetical protein [Curtobacterium]|uniref:hypothetical protein n=1 Tax=Curtobacterium TaxID=2034 RepID=UPI0018E5472C|nr:MULTISPECIES: hypothetical protein [Curtobacterium]MCA5923026.1 hypothetical protein [Curtobacterium oceanosedimentum]QQD74948.1 hypothetical protein I8920_08620 [Curtobacterium sp. YC1]
MHLFAPLPDRPAFKIDGTPEDDAAVDAWSEGATVDEWLESERTGVVTLSMRVKWWWRRTRRVLR